MLRSLTRALAALAVVPATALLAAGPAAAQAATYEASSSATGVELTVLGSESLVIADASSSIDGSPSAIADALGISLAEGSASDASVSTAGSRDQDGQNCALPDLPEDLAAILSLDPACSTVLAETEGGLPSADATAALSRLAVDAEPLVGALTDTALLPIEGELDAAFATVEDTVLVPVIDALEQACASIDLPDLTAPIQDVLDQVPTDALPTDALPEDDPCAVLLRFIADAPELTDDVQATIDAIRDAVTAALADVEALALAVDSSASSAAATDAVTGLANYETVRVEALSLALAGPLVDAVFADVLGTWITEIEELLAPLGDGAPDVTALEEVLAELEGLLDLGLLDSDEPLLVLEVLGASASATFDPISGTTETSGEASVVQVTLSQALADLLGVERQLTVDPGESVTILEGTPLESTISVGEVTEDETSVTAAAAEIDLLTGVEGGIGVVVGAVSAAATGPAGAAPEPGPEPAPDLPTTGGGLALAGLAVMLGGTFLRRR